MVEVSGPTWTTSVGGHSHDRMRTLDVVPKCSKYYGEGDNGCEGEAGRWLCWSGWTVAVMVRPDGGCDGQAGRWL